MSILAFSVAWLRALLAEAQERVADAVAALEQCRALLDDAETVLLANRCGLPATNTPPILSGLLTRVATAGADGPRHRPRNDVIKAALVDLFVRRLRGQTDAPSAAALPFVLLGEWPLQAATAAADADPAAGPPRPPKEWEEWRLAVAHPSPETLQALQHWRAVRRQPTCVLAVLCQNSCGERQVVGRGAAMQSFEAANDAGAVWLIAVAAHIHAAELLVRDGVTIAGLNTVGSGDG